MVFALVVFLIMKELQGTKGISRLSMLVMFPLRCMKTQDWN